MIHYMKLWNDAFTSIKDGTKTIEMRLYDDKRQMIKIGDTIEFNNIKTQDKLRAVVINLHVYDSFDELFSHFSKEQLGYNSNDFANPKDMLQYYSDEMINEYGVVGIELKLL